MADAENTWVAAFGVDDPGSASAFDSLPAKATERQLFLVRGTRLGVLGDTENVRAIVDGNVYNRPQLRDLLADQSEEGPSDATLVARAYECWGTDALNRVKGIFVAVIWDKQRRRLLCVRDPLGMHPLFYTQTQDLLLVSPAIECLLKQPGVSRDFNRARLMDHLVRRMHDPAETCYAKISRIPPGHLLQVDAQDTQARRYWNPLPEDQPIDWVDDDDAQKLFEAALHQAVSRQIDNGSVGVLLSGGIDSSTVAAIAAGQCTSRGLPPPWAVSLTLPQRQDAESAGMEIAADLAMPRLQMSYETAFGSDGLLASGVGLASRLSAPLYNALAPAFLHLLERAHEKGCTVMLTGEGADEWLGMSPDPAANLLRPTDVIELFRLSRVLSRSYESVNWAGMKGVFWHYGAKPPIRRAWNLASTYVGGRRGQVERLNNEPRVHRWVPPEPWMAPDSAFRQQLGERWGGEPSGEKMPSGREDAYRHIKRVALDAAFQGLRSEEAFQLRQMSRVAVRDPFLDSDLVALLARIRPRAKARGGVAKALSRDLLARQFPGRGFESQRKSTARIMHLQSLIVSESARTARGLQGRWILDEMGVIDARQAAQFLACPPDGKAWRVWDLVNLESWVRAHR